MNSLRSGEVARAAGINQQTLRYYERRGLLPEPHRSNGGHRLYDEQAVTVLRAIKAAQRLGFTLDEMRNAVRCPPRTYPAADVDADGRRRLEVVAGS